MKKDNNLLKFKDFTSLGKFNKKTKRTEIGGDVLSENILSKRYSILNKNLIKRLKNLYENGTNDEIIDFLESIINRTKSPNAAKLDLLRDESNDGVYRAKPKNVIYSLYRHLEENRLSDITIYGPNHGLNGWMVTDSTPSFSG